MVKNTFHYVGQVSHKKRGFVLYQDIFWIRFWQVMRFLRVVFIIGLFVLALYYITPLVLPFIIGLIIALILNKPVDLIEKNSKAPRWLAVLIVLVLFLSVFVTLVTFLILEVVSEITYLMQVLPMYIQQMQVYFQNVFTQDIFTNLYQRFNELYYNLDPEYQNQLQTKFSDSLNGLANEGQKLIEAIFRGLRSFLLSLPSAATLFVISLLAAFFISKDLYKLRKQARNIIPIKAHSRIRKVYADLKQALFGFIKAQLTLISITGVIVIVGLLVLRVEYAITIGLLAGLVDLLPYLGTGAVFVPWIIYLFFAENYSMVIGLSILYGIVIVQRQVMEPKILASNVGLDPLVTLIALFVGLKLFGFLGLIVGPVSIVILMSLYRARVFQDLWTYIKTGEFS